MKLQQNLFAVFTLVGLAALPVLGQMPGMPSGSKMPAKSTPAKATTKKITACCMSGMKMGKMMSSLSAAEKKKMRMCCMAGMKPGDIKMDKMKMGKCCMAGMKAAGMKPGGKGMPGMGADKKPTAPPISGGMGGNR